MFLVLENVFTMHCLGWLQRGQHTGVEEDLEEKVTFLVVSPSTMKSLVKRLINNLPLPFEVSKILSPGVDDDTL